MERNMDFLFKDCVSKQYLEKYTNLIATKLSYEQLEYIKSNNITLLWSSSPGMVILNFVFPVIDKPLSGHIIAIDNNFIHLKDSQGKELFDIYGIVALIMHEIGHICNKPNRQEFSSDNEFNNHKEYFADKYAISLNTLFFRKCFISLLKKTSENEIPYIDNKQKEELKERLRRIENDNIEI